MERFNGEKGAAFMMIDDLSAHSKVCVGNCDEQQPPDQPDDRIASKLREQSVDHASKPQEMAGPNATGGAQQTRAAVVHGWQLTHNLGLGILTLGVGVPGPDGQEKTVQTPRFLLSEQYCRDLARHLLMIADKLRGAGSNA